jgi:hypothetical protein
MGLFQSKKNVKKDLTQQVQKLALRLNKDDSYKISFGIGRAYKDIKDLTKSYLEALRAQQQNFLFNGGYVLHVDDIEPPTNVVGFYPFQKEKLIDRKCKIRQNPRKQCRF